MKTPNLIQRDKYVSNFGNIVLNDNLSVSDERFFNCFLFSLYIYIYIDNKFYYINIFMLLSALFSRPSQRFKLIKYICTMFLRRRSLDYFSLSEPFEEPTFNKTIIQRSNAWKIIKTVRPSDAFMRR